MPSADILPVLLSAFVVTFATVVVPSPSTIAASRFALSHGTRGAAACLGGVVTLDILVFLGLAFGLEPALYAVGGHRYLVPVAGAFLTVAGVVMIVTAPRHLTDRLVSDRGRQHAEREMRLHGPFLAGLIIPAANPGFWLWWASVGTAFIHAARRFGRLGLALLLGAFLAGVLSWYVPLLLALRRGREVFSGRTQTRLLVALGIGMVAFGLHLLWRAFG